MAKGYCMNTMGFESKIIALPTTTGIQADDQLLFQDLGQTEKLACYEQILIRLIRFTKSMASANNGNGVCFL